MLRNILQMASTKAKVTGSKRARRVMEKVKARVLERKEVPVLHPMLVTFSTTCRPDSQQRTNQMRQSSQRGQRPSKHGSTTSATCGIKSKRWISLRSSKQMNPTRRNGRQWAVGESNLSTITCGGSLKQKSP